MIGGAHGKILHVDLATGKTWVERPAEEVYHLLVGGRALVSYLLLRDLPAGTDPFSPDNLLIFAPGLMQGTSFPGAGRHGVGGKSPLTGALGSSEAGGWWGHEFKRAGWDALAVHGRAPSPVYLWIRNGEVEVRPAGHLWGLQTAPAQAAIRAELADERARVAQIGPAGEKRVRYAAVMHDVNRAAGRNGLGALMGSKNLKAVAVRGTRTVPVAGRPRLAALARRFGETYREEMAWAAAGIGRGTQDGVMRQGRQGGLPTRNFREPLFPWEVLSGERNYAMFYKGRDTCQGCPVRCKQVFENRSDDPSRSLDPVYGGAEYEAMAAFGSCCGVEDNLAVLKANELANAYGLDSISTGACIAFAMECFEHGLLKASGTGGLEIRWGDGERLVQLVGQIARREGVGDLLAEGVARVSRHLGPESEPFALVVKGQELPMHEPRLKHAMGLGYAVAPVGADHMMNIHDTAYTRAGAPVDRVNSAAARPVSPVPRDVLDEDKLQIFCHEVNFAHAEDCALICQFYPYDYRQVAEALSAVSGVDYSIYDLLRVGARAQTLARLFNLREGLGAEDDRLPGRVMSAFGSGPLAGVEIRGDAFSWARRRFYELMQWDAETGAPTEACLDGLGLASLLG